MVKNAIRKMTAWRPWIRTAILGLFGGVMAASYTMIIEPDSYHLPQDFGSGKLWKYFIGGVVLTVSGILIESPLGKKLMRPFEDNH
jgi:hypothetical protein